MWDAVLIDDLDQDLHRAGDAALIVSVGRWHESALEEIYRRHGGAVFGLARRVLRDQRLAEDVAQEVFVRLWNAPEAFDPDRGTLRAFLLAQAHRRAVDVVRAEEARRRREQRQEGEGSRSALMTDTLDRELWDLTVAEEVRAALEELPSRERDAIELAYFGGLTYREVAAELDEPEGTVKSRIRAGLRRLRTQLAAAGVTT